MRNGYLAVFTAASIAAFGLVAQAQDQSAQSQQQQQQQTATSGQQQQQAGAGLQATGAGAQSGEQSPHAEDIRRVLARVTEAAVKGDVKEVADNFVTSAQDQFGRRGGDANLTGPDARAASDQNRDASRDEMKAMDEQLKQTAQQLSDAWKQKYGHDFNIDRKAEEVVYGGQTFQILKGDMGRAGQAQTAGARVGATGSGLDQQGTAASADQQRQQQTGQQATGSARIGDTTVSGTAGTTGAAGTAGTTGDDNRSVRERLAGRGDNRDLAADAASRMATVVVQPSHGAPMLTVTLVNEGTFGNRWHIQPAPGLDRKTLSQNLNQHLQQVVSMKDQWPQDENEAYRAVSHHVLAAIAMPPGAQQRAGGAAGQSSDTGSAQPAGSQQQPSQDQSSQQPSQQGQQSGQQSQPEQNR